MTKRGVSLQCSSNSFPFLPSFILLPHLVLVALAHLAELPAELDIDLEVEVALVPLVWLHREVAAQLLALLAGDVVLEVEDCLLPVRVGRLGRGGEAHPLVAHAELDVPM